MPSAVTWHNALTGYRVHYDSIFFTSRHACYDNESPGATCLYAMARVLTLCSHSEGIVNYDSMKTRIQFLMLGHIIIHSAETVSMVNLGKSGPYMTQDVYYSRHMHELIKNITESQYFSSFVRDPSLLFNLWIIPLWNRLMQINK